MWSFVVGRTGDTDRRACWPPPTCSCRRSPPPGTQSRRAESTELSPGRRATRTASRTVGAGCSTYSLPSVGPGADPGVEAVSPRVTLSHPPGGRLPLLSGYLPIRRASPPIGLHQIISARCNIYISRLCYDVSVRLSVRLSVMEVHCGHGACREEGGHLALC